MALRRLRPFGLAVVALAAVVVLTPAAAGAAATTAARIALAVVSNTHPEMVSGGQALFRVTPGPGVNTRSVVVSRNGENVTSAFVRQADGTMLGLVAGLQDGTNSVVASVGAGAGAATAQVTVVDHPLGGPVFSGRQLTPFLCRTQDSGLGVATSSACDAPTKVTYRYKTTGGAFRTVDNPAQVPRKVATTTTTDGRTVRYVVRFELGVVDRSVYQFGVLYDGANPSPTRANKSWNGSLVYSFSGGCNAGYTQGVLDTSGTGPANDVFLGQGYAVATATLNTSAVNCSTVIAAETAMMVKERFIETFGPVTHTMGWGGSGGGTQQLAIADSYPGILDGIVPNIAFPNFVGNQLDVAADCHLLDGYFARTPTSDDLAFSTAQRTAVAGFPAFDTCGDWDRGLTPKLTPTGSCLSALPRDWVYDPVTNPSGITCSVSSQNVAQLGVDPGTGLVNAVVDNVGVQYGLSALLQGVISPAQFADLNAGVGGVDYRGQTTPARTAAVPSAVRAVYADNLFLDGGLGLATTPVIDLRTYTDPRGTVHTSEWSYVVRARMLAAGTAANSAIVELGDRGVTENQFAIDAMKRWLDAISADTSDRSAQEKVAAARPAGLGDGCFLDTSGTFTPEALAYGTDSGPCAEQFPVLGNTRTVAGQSVAMDQLTCALVPLDRASYPVEFSDESWAELEQAFPTGVCDWTAPSPDRVAPLGTWLSYSTPGAAPQRTGG